MRPFCTSRHCTQIHLVISTVSIVYVLYNLKYLRVNFQGKSIMLDDEPQSTEQSHHSINEPSVKYNLMEETYGREWKKTPEKYYNPLNCTLEYANAQKLQQDHPCVVRLIQETFLRQPSPRNIAYKLNNPALVDPSDGQSKGILRLLGNHTNGFFVECGAFDGEFLSNTLYMERWLNWTGLLIEGDQKSFHQLTTRNRKAYTASVCLSTKPYPIQVLYDTTHPLIGAIAEKNSETLEPPVNVTANVHQKQCFPIYSILLAIGGTEIDYFSLDVEGSEYKILKTIPWLKVNIKTLTVEWEHAPEGEIAITRLMEKNKFVKFGRIEMAFSREVVYIQDFLNDLRMYE